MVQSAQPIVSYNYGCGQLLRSNKALRLCIISAVVFALLISGVFVCFSSDIVSLFLPDRTSHAWQYAVAGLPFVRRRLHFFRDINVITIGYYTSIERINLAMRLDVAALSFEYMDICLFNYWDNSLNYEYLSIYVLSL